MGAAQERFDPSGSLVSAEKVGAGAGLFRSLLDWLWRSNGRASVVGVKEPVAGEQLNRMLADAELLLTHLSGTGKGLTDEDKAAGQLIVAARLCGDPAAVGVRAACRIRGCERRRTPAP